MPIYSCVVDNKTKFKRQAYVFCLTLMKLAQVRPQDIVLHIMEGVADVDIGVFTNLGVQTVPARPFDPRHPHSNKLVQLETATLHEADYVILCDCDLAFAADISGWLVGDRLRAKVVDFPWPPLEVWRDLLNAAGFAGDVRKTEATHKAEATYFNNLNGGLYIVPQTLFQTLRPIWPKWDLWLLERKNELGSYSECVDQIAMGLSLAELEHVPDHLPVTLNYPIQHAGSENTALDTQPLVIHHHSRPDPRNPLTRTGVTAVDEAVNRVNAVIQEYWPTNVEGDSFLQLDRTLTHRLRRWWKRRST